MSEIICPKCGSANVYVARDMKATRRCGKCAWSWLPAQDALPASQPEGDAFAFRQARSVAVDEYGYDSVLGALSEIPILQAQVATLTARQPVSDVEAETYRQMHDTAKEMGYPSILDALEALSDIKASMEYRHSLIGRTQEQVATLTARVETLEGALRPFAKVAYDIITNRPDDEVLADSMAADRLTWGDLRKARAALSPDPAVKPSAEAVSLDCFGELSIDGVNPFGSTKSAEGGAGR